MLGINILLNTMPYGGVYMRVDVSEIFVLQQGHAMV